MCVLGKGIEKVYQNWWGSFLSEGRSSSQVNQGQACCVHCYKAASRDRKYLFTSRNLVERMLWDKVTEGSIRKIWKVLRNYQILFLDFPILPEGNNLS